MRISQYLLKSVTFYTRPQCGLCGTAKTNLMAAGKTVPFDYKEVNIDEPENKEFYDLYAFDVPVMKFEDGSSEKIVMHRITTEQAIETLNSL
ncbi:hypothetical protein B9G98_01724 [Wickerhamiella sorbophila]|uniref:Glutaredoxin-like protein n=1 Tax=Wickerhamiella sorbophila TaxID=45607 RepID=A0A2T0FGJ9_9ASCO|nr:hypothetical protein B9G98_01724 [Wickerhamiella sorbophila]PRT54104.1 hypothetical protein B9G98_01724 [Wickerhamiella sorbophila]